MKIIFSRTVGQNLGQIDTDVFLCSFALLVGAYIIKFLVSKNRNYIEFFTLLNDFLIDVLLIFIPLVIITLFQKVSLARGVEMGMIMFLAVFLCAILRACNINHPFPENPISSILRIFGQFMTVSGFIFLICLI